MNAEIKFLRFEHRFGRLVAMAQLYSENKLLRGDSPLSILLSLAEQEGYVIINSQETLVSLVIKGGFAS